MTTRGKIAAALMLLLLCSMAEANVKVRINQNNGKVRVNTRYNGEGFEYDSGVDIDGNAPAQKNAGKRTELTANGIFEVKVDSATTLDAIKVRVNDKVEEVYLIGVVLPAAEKTRGRAGDYVAEKLKNRYVWLQTDTQVRDRHNRVHAYIWLDEPSDSADGQEVRKKMLNADLLLKGYLRTAAEPPNTLYADLFHKYEQEADALGRSPGENR